MDAVMISNETDNTEADTTAPDAAKETQTVVRESVSISKKPYQVNLSYLHYDKFQLECEAIVSSRTKLPKMTSHSHWIILL